MTPQLYTQAQIDAMPEYGTDRVTVLTDPQTGRSFPHRAPARFIPMRDQGFVRDGRGVLWLIGDAPDGTTYKQRIAS